MFESLNSLLGPAYFGLFAAAAIICGLLVLIARHPLNGAVSLVGVMISLSGIYALLNAPFLGVLQILVYAGAIMMLVVFVIMVLNKAKDHQVPRFDLLSVAGLILPVIIGLVLVHGTTNAGLPHNPVAGSARAEVGTIAPRLFDMSANGPGFYLLFELIGILLLVAIVAAVLLAKRELDTTPAAGAEEDHHGSH